MAVSISDWFVSDEWGGGFSIRRKDERGEWLLAFLRDRAKAEHIVEAVNCFRHRTDVPSAWFAAADAWKCVRKGDSRIEVWPAERNQPGDWPIASFNKPGDAALMVKAIRWFKTNHRMA